VLLGHSAPRYVVTQPETSSGHAVYMHLRVADANSKLQIHSVDSLSGCQRLGRKSRSVRLTTCPRYRGWCSLHTA
jgi:hypothetical protein